MSPIPTKQKTEREQQIEQLRAQVATAERRGHFDTVHHDMLRELEQPQPKETTKESE